MTLRSHIKPILALDWSPNGYQVATAGEDNTIRIWDIRAAKCVYTVPAHNNLITQVKYWHGTDAFESDGKYRDWSISNQGRSDEMDMDQSSDKPDTSRRQLLDGSFLISSSYDGTCKLWTDGDYKPIKALSGVEAKVMSADVSGGTVFINLDAKYIVTALYDRTFKLHESTSFH